MGKKILHKNIKVIFLIGMLLGFGIFLLIYGVHVLNFTYDSWLYEGGDLSQHYLGWRFYRASSWHFPIGLVEGLAYPAKTSVIYTDSIPLLAVPFKLLSNILPSTFQYFGLWGALSFSLQGGISAVILQKFSKNTIFTLSGSILFILSPPVLQRMFTHTALAGHFVLLLPLAYWIYYDEIEANECGKTKWSKYKGFFTWVGFGILTVFTHAYFVPMVGGIMFGFILDKHIISKWQLQKGLLIFISFALSVLTSMYFMGAFYGSPSFGSSGLGIYSSNLNTFYQSGGYSLLFPALKQGSGQYEGYGYLGLGAILLVVLSIGLLIFHKLHTTITKKKNGNTNKANKSFYICIIFVASVFFILALSPVVMFNENTLFTLNYPKFIVNILSIFRSSGRFIWCTFYIILILSALIVTEYLNRRTGCVLLCFFAIIQATDLTPRILSLHKNFSNIKMYHSISLVSPEWEQIANRFKHIVFLPYGTFLTDTDVIYSFAKYASDNNMTLNVFYQARDYGKNYASAQNEYWKQIKNGEIDKETLFIIDDTEEKADFSNIYLGILDGFVIGSKEYLPYLSDYSIAKEVELKNDNGDIFLCQGEDFLIPIEGLEKGSYQILIKGEQLKKIKLQVRNFSDQEVADSRKIVRHMNNLFYTFSLTEKTEKVEIVISNEGVDTKISKVLLRKIEE